jgi:hypothetical protein
MYGSSRDRRYPRDFLAVIITTMIFCGIVRSSSIFSRKKKQKQTASAKCRDQKRLANSGLDSLGNEKARISKFEPLTGAFSFFFTLHENH